MKPILLVIDDEENMLALLSKVLGKEGYQILCASSGAEGLTLAEKNPVDLALVDYSMAGMDGLTVLQNLKAAHPRLPAILITAFPTWEMEKKAQELGCLDYLTKPLDMKRLKERIKNILKHSMIEGG